jgi:hypothetical protein
MVRRDLVAGSGRERVGLDSPAFLLTEIEKEGDIHTSNCTFENNVRLSINF